MPETFAELQRIATEYLDSHWSSRGSNYEYRVDYDSEWNCLWAMLSKRIDTGRTARSRTCIFEEDMNTSDVPTLLAEAAAELETFVMEKGE